VKQAFESQLRAKKGTFGRAEEFHYSSARNSGHACNREPPWKSDTPKDLRITQNRSINPIRTK
jgi:hypothetical protein